MHGIKDPNIEHLYQNNGSYCNINIFRSDAIQLYTINTSFFSMFQWFFDPAMVFNTSLLVCSAKFTEQTGNWNVWQNIIDEIFAYNKTMMQYSFVLFSSNRDWWTIIIPAEKVFS